MKNVLMLDTVAIINPIAKERLTLVEPEFMSIESLPKRSQSSVEDSLGCL
ncbi:hypothetical protein [Gloeothece citriformis]|nr:hypothetical protein [Gloeothece citriformis]